MNMYRKLKTVLYHGTVSSIDHIDVGQGRGNKDFGKGFYMAVSRKQAIGMMHKKYKEALRRNRNKKEYSPEERLYEITLDKKYMETLNVKLFDCADEEWLDFILMCREKGGMPHDYDLVVGPTADDDTMLCLKTYWDGLYGKTGSIQAKRILMNNLEPENLGIQYYVGKQKVADRLITGIKEIPWR